MLTGIGTGIAYCLGAILVAAGLLKAFDLPGTRRSLTRLLPRGRGVPSETSRRLTWAAILLAATEVSLGVALGAVPRVQAIGALALALFAAFPWVARRARRLGASCGCFGSFSTRVAGPKEAARATALATCAVVMFALNAAGGSDPPAPTFEAAGFVAASALVAVTTALAPPRRARPWPGRRDADRNPAAWRATPVWNHVQVLRSVRADPQVKEVLARDGRRLRWRLAKVAVSGRPVRITQVLVSGDATTLHVIIPATGRPAVILFTPEGPRVPAHKSTPQRRDAPPARPRSVEGGSGLATVDSKPLA
jgi:hypothetical protein